MTGTVKENAVKAGILALRHVLLAGVVWFVICPVMMFTPLGSLWNGSNSPELETAQRVVNTGNFIWALCLSLAIMPFVVRRLKVEKHSVEFNRPLAMTEDHAMLTAFGGSAVVTFATVCTAYVVTDLEGVMVAHEPETFLGWVVYFLVALIIGIVAFALVAAEWLLIAMGFDTLLEPYVVKEAGKGVVTDAR